MNKLVTYFVKMVKGDKATIDGNIVERDNETFYYDEDGLSLGIEILTPINASKDEEVLAAKEQGVKNEKARIRNALQEVLKKYISKSDYNTGIDPLIKVVDNLLSSLTDKKNARYLYYLKENLIDAEDFKPVMDTSECESFQSTFRECRNTLSFPSLNTSNGIDFQNMYRNSILATEIGAIDTSKGVYFGGMFNNCKSLIYPNITNTHNGVEFNAMFKDCISMTSVPKLDISKAEKYCLMNMFDNCTSLTELQFENGIKVGGLDVSDCPLTVESLKNIANQLADSPEVYSIHWIPHPKGYYVDSRLNFDSTKIENEDFSLDGTETFVLRITSAKPSNQKLRLYFFNKGEGNRAFYKDIAINWGENESKEIIITGFSKQNSPSWEDVIDRVQLRAMNTENAILSDTNVIIEDFYVIKNNSIIEMVNFLNKDEIENLLLFPNNRQVAAELVPQEITFGENNIAKLEDENLIETIQNKGWTITDLNSHIITETV